VSSVIGLVYYLRIVAVMYATPDPEARTALLPLSPLGRTVLATLTGLLVSFGVYPMPLLHVIENIFPK
jgi:NADH-quinone oxidoreductase subunit N